MTSSTDERGTNETSGSDAGLGEATNTPSEGDAVSTDVSGEEVEALLEEPLVISEEAQAQDIGSNAATFAGERAIKVLIHQGILPLENATFDVNVFDSSNTLCATDTIQVNDFGEQYRKGSKTIRGLVDGTYRIQITADQFSTYVQKEVVLKGNDASVTIYTDRVQMDPMPGIMAYGDVSGDNKIDGYDASRMIDVIQQGKRFEATGADKSLSLKNDDGTVKAEYSSFDLKNNEGEENEIDLVDLQVLAEGLNLTDGSGFSAKTATPTTLASTSDIVPTVPETTVIAAKVGQTVEETLGSLINNSNADSVEFSTATNEVISESNPVEATFNLGGSDDAAIEMEAMVIVAPHDPGANKAISDNSIAKGTVMVELEDGSMMEFEIDAGDVVAASERNAQSLSAASALAANRAVRGLSAPSTTMGKAKVEPDGTILIDFKGMVAVKKVTLKITATTKGTNLAEISSVEFLNNMEERIAPPEMNIPGNLQAKPSSKQFSVSWNREPNVTGYELSVREKENSNGAEDFVRIGATDNPSLDVSKFNGKKIRNNTTFLVRVQSMNGDWRSGWSEAIEVTPKADKQPPAPESVKVKGGYRILDVSWKDMEDTDYYTVEYKQKGASEWTQFGGNLETNKLQITGLTDNTDYLVRVFGYNDFMGGSKSAPSAETAGRTISVSAAKLPEYKLVNTKNANGYYLNHITTASVPRGTMVDSPLDEGSKTALGLFDGNYQSYSQVNDWDDGGAYPASNKGVAVAFDTPQTINMVSLAEVQDIGNYVYVHVAYKAPGSKDWTNVGANIYRRNGENNRKYYVIKLNQDVVADQIRVGLGRYGSSPGRIIVAEMRFHYDGGIESDIMGLYTDTMHLSLRNDVTMDTITDLRTRLNTPDPASGELHPFKSLLEGELDYAEKILTEGSLNDTKVLKTEIAAARDSKRNLGIGGLNSWQPLGVAAGAGEELVIYVNAPGATLGANAPLQLTASQQHPESSGVAQGVQATLKVGRNVIDVPQLSQMADVENGGQMYISYTGATNVQWAVRVKGGTEIPTLNLHYVRDADQRLQLTTDYIRELTDHVAALQATHKDLHESSELSTLQHSYDDHNCIANATDIVLDQMMYSVPASQVLAAAGGSTPEEKAATLLNALDGMDENLEIFYQHKGMMSTKQNPKVTDAYRVPYQHLNIRYCRMFTGAFMYASGNHIGIEWGSVGGICQKKPVLNADGSKASGQYFGWGLNHEIGHNINQGQYSLAEITNNYFAQLAKTDETNETTRGGWEKALDRVSSGEEGRTRDVFTQLKMYWQLRLMYDSGHPFKLYTTQEDMLNGYLFAKIDTYARNPSLAPKPNNVSLTISGGESQVIMRLASAAAQKNLTEFFGAWGLVPDATTTAYISQFPVEERAVQYIDDNAKGYIFANEEPTTVKGKEVVATTININGSNVELNMSASSVDPGDIQGYEIARTTYSEGQAKHAVVGFVRADGSGNASYVDRTSSIGNRAVTYEVTLIDKFMNRSQKDVLEPVKLKNDGMLVKDGWTVTTNMVSDTDQKAIPDEEDPDQPTVEPQANKIVDEDFGTIYTGFTGTVSGSESTGPDADPQFVIDMGKTNALTSLRYVLDGAAQKDMSAWTIEVSTDGEEYTPVSTTGEAKLNEKSQLTLFFNNGTDPWICTYDARYVRITAVGEKGQSIAISEIELFSPSGDDVDFLPAGEGTAIGKLERDFEYQKEGVGSGKQVIPAGSIVFTGTYKGNPAYNVVVLYDEQGNIVGGVDAEGNIIAQQIILAPQLSDDDAKIGNTSEGRWVYYIEPKADGTVSPLPANVRAELFRVDNALTNEGQRQVSDSLMVSVPTTLPNVNIEN